MHARVVMEAILPAASCAAACSPAAKRARDPAVLAVDPTRDFIVILGQQRRPSRRAGCGSLRQDSLRLSDERKASERQSWGLLPISSAPLLWSTDACQAMNRPSIALASSRCVAQRSVVSARSAVRLYMKTCQPGFGAWLAHPTKHSTQQLESIHGRRTVV